MGLFSGGKKQKGQDAAIIQVALYDPDKARRGEAIKQLVDQDLLFEIAMHDEDEWIRLTAALQLTGQKHIFEVITKGPKGRAQVHLLEKLTKVEYLFSLVTKSEDIGTRWYAMVRLDEGKSQNFGDGVCSFYDKELLKTLGVNEHVRYRSILKTGDPKAIRVLAADDSLNKKEDVEARMAAVARLSSQEDLFFVVESIVDVCRKDTERVLWALMCAIEDKSKLIELLRRHPNSFGNFRLHGWLGIADQYDRNTASETGKHSKTSPVIMPPRQVLDRADFRDATGLFEDFNFKLLVVDALLDKSPSFGSDLAKLADEYLLLFEHYVDGPIAEIVSYLSRLELSQEDLDKVTGLVFDGGNRIFGFIKPDWDGEDDLFDVHSVKGFELLRNLKSVFFTGLCDDVVLYPIRDAGITIEGSPLR